MILKLQSLKILITLLIILTIGLTATASDLQKVSGYLISDELSTKLIEQYPSLETILNNAIYLEPGYYMSDNTTIELSNKISRLETENKRLQAKVDTLNNALDEERAKVDELLQSKDNIIELQQLQIDDYKTLYEAEQSNFLDDARNMATGAGVMALIMYLSD